MMFPAAKKVNTAPVNVRGFTLVELMISITLGLILVAGVAYTYLGNRTTFRQQDGLARMQEGARHAFEVLDFDIRMAGFIAACDIQSRANLLMGGTADGSGWTATSGTLWYANLFAAPVRGFETGATLPSGITALDGDSLGVIRADYSQEYIVSAHIAPTITLTAAQNIAAGDILLAADCRSGVQQASMFQAGSATVNGTTAVSHETGGSGPGNCNLNLFGNALCGGTAGSLAMGSRLVKVSSHFYFIRNNAAGQPSLYRRTLAPSGGNVGFMDEELIEGVEDMQITYGVDNTPTPDGVIDGYFMASQMVSGTVQGANDSERWGRVMSVKISLLLRSIENNVTTESQTYTFDGSTTSKADRRLRKVFTTTIALRNRI